MTSQESPSSSVKAKAVLELIRPVNCSMMGFAVVIGEYLALKALPSPHLILLGFAVGFTLTAFSMAVNDYYDLPIDEINAPQRPLPSGRLAPKEAVAVSLVFLVLGLLAAALTTLEALVIAVLAAIIAFTYNSRAKRTGLPGNFLVALCVAIPFIFGGATVGNIPPLLGILFLIALLATVGREVTKGIADMKGDAEKGVKTLAVRYGAAKAALAASIFYLLAVALTPLPVALGEAGLPYVLVILIVDAGFLYASFKILTQCTPSSALKIKNRVLLFMLLALIAFLLSPLPPHL
ncbi:MAG TPA: hypothetical protein ENF82_05465 [Candidatus Methanomethylia archaeon]|nr:hypothetical protein [Candidatus Methanomethylicia archaeon]